MHIQPPTYPSPSIHDLCPEETLYFLHIHKTAGSSLRGYIYDHFPRRQTCLLPWELPAIMDRPPAELARYRCIAGHYGYYLERILGKPLVYVTMLRDPVERTISAFYDQRWREDLWLHDHIKNMTLEDYVFDQIGTREVMNFQTCSIAFDDVQRHYYGLAELWRDAEATRAVLGDRAMLDLAKERIERFAFVGLQDRFEESMRLLAYTFGWPAPDRTPYTNVRRKAREELPDRVLARIQEITALDQELYNFVRERFDLRCSGLTDGLIAERHRRAMKLLPRQEGALLRFESGIVGSGWQDRETTASWAGRWTGPGTAATLHLALRGGRPYTLFARVGALAPDISDRLRLEANGVPLNIQREPCAESPRHICIRAAIAPDVVARSPEYLALTMRVPRTISPKSVNSANRDERKLGLYVQVLEVLPDAADFSAAQWSARIKAQVGREREAATAPVRV